VMNEDDNYLLFHFVVLLLLAALSDQVMQNSMICICANCNDCNRNN
jgi:hypothetical protein